MNKEKKIKLFLVDDDAVFLKLLEQQTLSAACYRHHDVSCAESEAEQSESEKF